MKKQFIIALISTFVGAGTFSSCSDYLDVENVLSQTETIDSLFAKREGVEKLLANIYSYIPEHVNGMIYEVVWNGASDELDMLYKSAPFFECKIRKLWTR